MTSDVYIWASPRDLTAEAAAELVHGWLAEGGDPASSPFEPSTDVAWFALELGREHPELTLVSDAAPDTIKTPIWLGPDDPPPARVVGIGLPSGLVVRAHRTIYSLAAKYDLVWFDPWGNHISFPLQEMAAQASATFWPGGAIQAGVAGTAGGIAAVVAWNLSIPILSGLIALAGGFMALGAIYTFIAEGLNRLRG